MDILTRHSPAWLAGMVLALVVTGAIAGLIAGLLDVGGGSVIVPVLYHPFTLLGIDESVRMHVTVGTSLATSIMSSRARRRRGSLDVSLIRRLMPGVVVAWCWAPSPAATWAVACSPPCLPGWRWPWR